MSMGYRRDHCEEKTIASAWCNLLCTEIYEERLNLHIYDAAAHRCMVAIERNGNAHRDNR